jgi:hypothetical protein
MSVLFDLFQIIYMWVGEWLWFHFVCPGGGGDSISLKNVGLGPLS